MKVKFSNGLELHLENHLGAAFVASGLATEIVLPSAPPKPYRALITYNEDDIARVTNKPQPGDRSTKTVTTGVSYEREQALGEKTKAFRPEKRGGPKGEQISVGDLCSLLGIGPKQIEAMSEERLRHLCVNVPRVPDAVSGVEWGQTPYRYEEFMGKGERWIDFLHRIRVPARTLISWERAQLAQWINRRPTSFEVAALVTNTIVHVD